MQEQRVVVDAEVNVLAHHDFMVVYRDRAILAASNIVDLQATPDEFEAGPAEPLKKGLVDLFLGSGRRRGEQVAETQQQGDAHDLMAQ